MNGLTTHGACGKSWRQRGNLTGHCGKCHETFEGLKAFDAHQRILPNGQVHCLDPSTVKLDGAVLRLINGTWRRPGMGLEGRSRLSG